MVAIQFITITIFVLIIVGFTLRVHFTDEILKRAAAPAENFAEIGFNYENEEIQNEGDSIGAMNRPNDFVDPDDKPYKIPKGLTLPVTVPRVSVLHLFKSIQLYLMDRNFKK